MKKSTYYELGEHALKQRLNALRLARRDIKDIDRLHVRISESNAKMGLIPSISLLPVIDCGNCGCCAKSCYDLRHDMIYPQSIMARSINSMIFDTNPARYFREIDAWLTFNYPRAFRWHIGGDIKSSSYLEGMVDIAEKHKDISFLAFTKMFNIINEYLDSGRSLPSNLKIIFSGWTGLDIPNPHNLPSAHPLFADGSTSAKDGAKLCKGNCTECLSKKLLCWSLKPGEEIVFSTH